MRILFSNKADSGLDYIMENFKLKETSEEAAKRSREKKPSKRIVIDHLVKDFAAGKLTEKDLVNSLRDELEVPQPTAEQIEKDILNRIVPFLEMVPEEKLNDPDFVEELAQRLFGEMPTRKSSGPGEYGLKKIGLPKEEEMDIFPTIKPLKSIAEPSPSVPTKKIRKSAVPAKQSRGSDKYREQI